MHESKYNVGVCDVLSVGENPGSSVISIIHMLEPAQGFVCDPEQCSITAVNEGGDGGMDSFLCIGSERKSRTFFR